MNPKEAGNSGKSLRNIKQEQIHNLLFSKELGWQEIIYDLINTEQLDPWDIDIIVLTNGYLSKIEQLEEADFFVSSKVLLAAALLLRIKSEVLLNKHLKSIDDILFGKKEEKKYDLERIELDEEIPELVPRSPMPRFKKVSLKELMEALNKAISTENRRIKKEIVNRSALMEIDISLPKKTINIRDKIKEVYEKLLVHLKEGETKQRVSYSEFIGDNIDEKVIAFSPLLHLENQQKVWMEQENHFEEIYIWMKKTYIQEKGDPFVELREEIEEKIQELDEEQKDRLEQINQDFENPLGEMFEE